MTRPVRSADGNVETSNNTYWIGDEIPYTIHGGPTNGMVIQYDGAIAVLTGTAMGAIGLRVEVHDQEPPLQTDDWDEVVECTVWSSEGELRVCDLSTVGPPEHFPNLSIRGEGGYRVRVHARGRDAAYDLVAFEPLEHHLIAVWPTDGDEYDPVINHKLTDQVGATRRANRG